MYQGQRIARYPLPTPASNPQYQNVRQASWQETDAGAAPATQAPATTAAPEVIYDSYPGGGYEQVMPQGQGEYFFDGAYAEGPVMNGYGSGGSCGYGSGGCRTGCCLRRPCVQGNAYVGVEATFLSPSISQSSFQVEPFGDLDQTPAGLNPFTYSSDVEYFTVAPRAWLGFRGCRGWGIQTRYWEAHWNEESLDREFVAFDPELIENASSGSSFSSLNLRTFDLEVTRDCCRGCRWMMGTLGVRHARYEQRDAVSTITLIDDLGDLDLSDLYTQQAAALRDFQGTGLTFSLAGSRPMRRGKNLSLFWNLRGSTLWGENRAEAATGLMGTYFIDNVVGAVDLEADRARDFSNQTLYIAEIQLGCRCSCLIKGLNARAFGQFALEYQYWNASGGNASVVETVGNIDNSRLVSTASTGSLDASLAGFTLSAGFTR